MLFVGILTLTNPVQIAYVQGIILPDHQQNDSHF
jgi:hypothetical protein